MSARQGIGLAADIWLTVDNPLGDARLPRGGPTIARPVTASCSEHPKGVLHSNGKNATVFDAGPLSKPLLPNKPRGVPRVNDRRVLNGIFWVLRSRAP